MASGFEYATEWYGPTVDGEQQRPSLDPGVLAVIVGWSLLTLSIIAGWVWMLWRPETLEPGRRASDPAGSAGTSPASSVVEPAGADAR